MVLLATYEYHLKLNTIEILMCKVLSYSNNSNDQFVLIDNVLKGYHETKEETKNSNNEYVWFNQTNTRAFVST